MTARELKRRLIREWRQQSLGALLAALFGLVVFYSRMGQGLDHWSYDWLFLFGAKEAPQEVVIVRMGDAALQALKQPHGQQFDRGLHARLLERLKEGRAKLVLFDVFFTEPGDAITNQHLADAMQAQGKVVLAGELLEDEVHPGLSRAR